MGYNMNNDIPLGQLGSAFTDTTGAINPPSGKVIVAITFMSDLRVSTLEGESATRSTNKSPKNSSGVAEVASFGHQTQTIGNGTGSDVTTSDQVFPKGITIYGRWEEFALAAADSTGGAICYFGY